MVAHDGSGIHSRGARRRRTTILSRHPESAARGLEKARVPARLLAGNELVDRGRAEHAAGLWNASTAFHRTVAGAGLAFKQELCARLDAWPTRGRCSHRILPA